MGKVKVLALALLGLSSTTLAATSTQEFDVLLEDMVEKVRHHPPIWTAVCITTDERRLFLYGLIPW